MSKAAAEKAQQQEFAEEGEEEEGEEEGEEGSEEESEEDEEAQVKAGSAKAQFAISGWGAKYGTHVTLVLELHGGPIICSVDDFRRVAAKNGGAIPETPYPETACGGACYNSVQGKSQGPGSPYAVVHEFFNDVVLRADPSATSDDVLIMQGNDADAFAFAAEPGALHACGDPHPGNGFAFCRGGGSAAKRVHIYILCGKVGGLKAAPDVGGGTPDIKAAEKALRDAIATTLLRCPQHKHELCAAPRPRNTCDVGGAGCLRTGTVFRCASGCDWDICQVCFDACQMKGASAASVHNEGDEVTLMMTPEAECGSGLKEGDTVKITHVLPNATEADLSRFGPHGSTLVGETVYRITAHGMGAGCTAVAFGGQQAGFKSIQGRLDALKTAIANAEAAGVDGPLIAAAQAKMGQYQTITVGSQVRVISSSDGATEPYVGKGGTLIEDDGSSRPFKVSLPDGQTYWFKKGEIVIASSLSSAVQDCIIVTGCSQSNLNGTYVPCGMFASKTLFKNESNNSHLYYSNENLKDGKALWRMNGGPPSHAGWDVSTIAGAGAVPPLGQWAKGHQSDVSVMRYPVLAIQGKVEQGTSPVTSASGRGARFGFLRFRTTCTRNPDESCLQIAQFVAFDTEGQELQLVDAINPGGDNPFNEGPANTLDGNPRTKWLDQHKGPLECRIAKGPSSIAKYSIVTANDCKGRDPVRWVLEARTRSADPWHVIDDRSDADQPVPQERFKKHAAAVTASNPVLRFSGGNGEHAQSMWGDYTQQGTHNGRPKYVNVGKSASVIGWGGSYWKASRKGSFPHGWVFSGGGDTTPKLGQWDMEGCRHSSTPPTLSAVFDTPGSAPEKARSKANAAQEQDAEGGTLSEETLKEAIAKLKSADETALGRIMWQVLRARLKPLPVLRAALCAL